MSSCFSWTALIYRLNLSLYRKKPFPCQLEMEAHCTLSCFSSFTSAYPSIKSHLSFFKIYYFTNWKDLWLFSQLPSIRLFSSLIFAILMWIYKAFLLLFIMCVLFQLWLLILNIATVWNNEISVCKGNPSEPKAWVSGCSRHTVSYT